jgi:hypothetical protein
MNDKQPIRESDDQREDRYWEIVGSGAYFPESWTIPRLTSPPGFSTPEAVDRARMQVQALTAAEFESTHPPEQKAWDELSEWTKFDNLRHWVDWDGVSRVDRARLIGGQLDAYELAVTRIPSHEHSTAIDMPELMEMWERLDPVNQKRLVEMPSLAELETFTEAVVNLRFNGKPDPFDRIVADLPQQWRRDGHADSGETWEEWNSVEKIGYLAEHAARHKVSFERFVDAASRTLGLASFEQFTADDIGHLLGQYRHTVERQRSQAGQLAAHDQPDGSNIAQGQPTATSFGRSAGDPFPGEALASHEAVVPPTDYQKALNAAADRGSSQTKDHTLER